VSESPEGWQAELRLGFTLRNGKTVLARRRHRGPLAVQRPFYPEGAVCHAYLLHPPGGVVGGDRLEIGVEVDPGARALLTTPAAGKFYRSDGRLARQSVSLAVGEGGCLEWLPQETIVYDGARIATDLRVDLAANAGFIGWEVFSLGRPACGEGFDRGEAVLGWRLRQAGRPLFLERLHLDGEAFRAVWGLRGRPICGTLFAWPASAASLEQVREIIADGEGAGVTLIDRLLVLRAADGQVEALQGLLRRVWAALRPEIAGRAACEPRIWAT
jgi:urease accessory protein